MRVLIYDILLKFMSVGSLNSHNKQNTSIDKRYQNEDGKKPILTIAIDIGNGIEKNLIVHDGDDPHQLALNFCSQNQIPINYAGIIKQNIKLNIGPSKQSKNEDENIDEDVEEGSKNTKSVHNELSEKRMHDLYLNDPDSRIEAERAEERTLFKRRVHSIDCISNIGEKLYHKGRLMREEFEKQIQYQQQRMIESELEAVTLRPKINKFYGKREGKLEDNLISYKYAIQDKNLKEKERRILEERESCTFKPDINRESEKMAVERKKQILAEMCNHSYVNEYEYLYEDSKRRIDNMNKVISASKEKECTFKPNRELTKYFQYKSEKKRKPKNNTSMNSRCDMFRPTTGRGPKGARNNEKLPIGCYLYKQRQNKKREIDKANQLRELEFANCKLQLNDSSECIYEKAKSEAFEYIFKCLDSDNDNKISRASINTKGTMLKQGFHWN